MPKHFIKARLHSFACAFRGFYFAITTQVNYVIHFTAAVLVILASWYYGITTGEWIAVWFCIMAVLAAETFNTAIEKLVDLTEPNHNPIAGIVKDLAAAAVLIAAIGSVIIAAIIFIPRVFQFTV